ncbi:MAG TPA: mercury methylation ferredoxin HgcB [Deltaproteobacteria bacterium]|nr:mercury methylation ferredoxin HgcB [Deltaproteobacteria bacterium]HXK46678.1 mercury methylation ferredoxin HgcB [Deltaproteobacteria bacterium]
MKKLLYLRDVATLQLDVTRCVGCGMCMEVCPHEVFRMNGKRVQIQNRDACMECGACSRNCPTDALSVQAGVGCAAAVINSMLGRDNASCCCVIDAQNQSCQDSRGKNSN